MKQRALPGGERSPGLLAGVLERGPVATEVGDEAMLTAMLEVEAALARAEVRTGLLSQADADAIERACHGGSFDVAAIGQQAAATGTPVVALVARIRDQVEGPAAGQVHRGATSQDIVDSATMLVAKRALGALVVDLRAASEAAAQLASRYARTPMAGRTLLQQALPTTFGLKSAGWMTGLDEAVHLLIRVRDERLAAQLGGAVGTLASLGADGPAVATAFAAELGLAEPVLPWHTNRVRIAELASALGIAAGSITKTARDVALLAQSEVGEVREGVPGRGRSSTLPQKRNPVAAVAAIASAYRAPGLAATIFGSMAEEHERAAGAWHAEWLAIRDLFIAVGSAAAWLRDCLEHLEVDPEAMRANLARSGGLILAERIVAALTPALGSSGARQFVEELADRSSASGRSFAVLLAESIGARDDLRGIDVDNLLDPVGYLGSAVLFVERALEAHRSVAEPS